MSKIVQEALAIVDGFIPPEKLYKDVVLINGETEGTYTFAGIAYLDEETAGKAVKTLDRDQQGFIFDEASKKISAHHEKDIRYRLDPLQKSYDLSHASTKTGRNYKKHIAVPGWVHILERGKKLPGNNISLFLDSLTYIRDGAFAYEGNPVEAETTNDKVFETLEKAGAFKELKSKPKLWDGGFTYDNGETSVRSYWFSDEGCFIADAGRPSFRNSIGFAVGELTNERVEVEKMEVVKREYEATLSRLGELELKVKNLSSKLENVKNIVV